MNSDAPTLFVVFGFPGSGKTYFASKFAKERGAFYANMDRTRLALFNKPTYKGWEHGVVLGAMDLMTREALSKGLDVVYDSNAVKRVYRNRLKKLAEESSASYLSVLVDTPEGLAWERIQETDGPPTEENNYRGNVPREAFDRMRSELEVPKEDEPHTVVSGTIPYEEQKEIVLKRLDETGN